MIRPAIILAGMASFLGSHLLAGDPITIDGFFDDWAGVPVAYSDGQGDGDQEDFAELKITHDDTFLFFQLTFHSPEFRLRTGNSITLYIDTDQNAETGLAIHGIGAELEWCFGCREGTFHEGEGTTPIDRSDLTLFMAPAFTSQTFEIALSLSSAPLTLNGTQIPDMPSLVLVSSGQQDFLPDDPGELEYLIDPTPVGLPASIPLSRTREEHLRIITYNTQFSGPLDPGRQPAFERIIKALDPDIIAFQEMGSASQVEPLIAEWLQTTSLWSVSVGNGNSVISRYPILDSAELIAGRRISAILVDTEAVLGTRLLLLNTHLIPFNDAMSQEDADELIMQLRVWRSGDGPFELAPDTPIVHVGDFNLAGSSQLLKTMRDGDIFDESRFGNDFLPDWDGTALTDLNSRQTGFRAGFTTSRGGASKLDYVFYTDSVMELGNHFILNTTTMSPAELAAGGLEAEDTDLASDHLPRVVDIAAIIESGTGEELYFAQFADGAGLFSQIILFNLDPDLEANLTLVLRDNEGNPLTVDLNGEQVSGQMTAVIPPDGLRRFRTDGLGDLVTGSVRVSSDRPVAGVVLFGGTDGLAGVGSSVVRPTGFVAPMEISTGSEINTGIAVANLEDVLVSLSLELVDGDGAVVASAQAALSGLGHLATFLPDFSWSPEVDFSDFEGTVKVSATGPIAGTVIQVRPGQLATLPVVPFPVQPALGTNIELNFAQFADGAGLFSQIILFNLAADMEANVTLVLRDNEGNPLSVDLNGEQVSGQMAALIPAGGLRSFKTSGLGELVIGSVTANSDQPLGGVILFGGTEGLAGVGGSELQPNGFVAPLETNFESQISTAIAVANLEEESITLTLQLRDQEGVQLALASLEVPGMGHLATFLPDFGWSPEVDFSDFQGTVRATATGPVAGSVIQTRPGQLATLPVVPVLSSPQALPIPPLDEGVMLEGTRTFNLLMQNGSSELIPGFSTPTSGYNGTFLGPTLLMHQGDEVLLNVTNQLDNPTSTHWHGLHVPAVMDGGPHQMIEPGETWTASYPVLNRAATYWYHPHLHPSGGPGVLTMDRTGTGYQVYRGLAGMIIVEDDTSDTLALPRSYGQDDIPVILQDRRFHEDGTLMHFPSDFNPATDPALRKGGRFLVNGVESPILEVGAQVIRLRILNASNARVYNLGFSDNRTFHQVASDGGFLNSPLPMSRLVLAPAERAEILLDLGADEGLTLTLRSFNSGNGTIFVPFPLQDFWDTADFDLLEIRIGPATADAVTTLPEALVTVARIPESEAVNAESPRPFELNANPFGINGKRMDMAIIDAQIRLGDTEVWEITNPNSQAHPFHVHGDSFQILSRDGASPPEHEFGWKDVVLVRPFETVRIIKRFHDYADPVNPYMFHCHILEHEDVGMMGQFVVVADP